MLSGNLTSRKLNPGVGPGATYGAAHNLVAVQSTVAGRFSAVAGSMLNNALSSCIGRSVVVILSFRNGSRGDVRLAAGQKRTLAKAAMPEKCQTHPPTRTCAILRGLIGGIYLVAEPWLGQRNCIQT